MMSYTHFTPEERECLAELYREGRRISEIAWLLNRNKSSVSRELKRNKNYFNRYNALGAERKYLSRRKKCRRKEILSEDSELKTYIIEKLKEYWSPEIIVLKWKEKHPECKLSASTVYRAIKKKLLPEISAQKHLRRRSKRRDNRKNRAAINPEHTIHEWDEEITNRLRVGDWEGDLVCGGIGKGCLLTMVDRRTSSPADERTAGNGATASSWKQKAGRVVRASCTAFTAGRDRSGTLHVSPPESRSLCCSRRW